MIRAASLSAIESGLQSINKLLQEQDDAGRLETINKLADVLATGLSGIAPACRTSGPSTGTGLRDLLDDIARSDLRGRLDLPAVELTGAGRSYLRRSPQPLEMGVHVR
jgi:hypothetical protein